MKVAIVHDWFVGGGAERVVYEIHKLYPKAPIYTAYCSDKWRLKFEDTEVITSYMQRWPFSKLRKFLPPLRALWFSGLDLSGFDLVISSSGAEAKFVKASTDAMHVSYIHAPTHYYWSRYEEYLKHPGFGWLDPVARIGLKILVGPMRRWDYKAAQRPNHLIANSNFTKEQIQKYYGRDSTVVHPPVDVERFMSQIKDTQSRQGFVTAGRQTPYKRFDLAVEAATKAEKPLIVIGKGPQHRRLKKMAGRNITFLRKVEDEQLAERFGEAEAFIFPGIDDFGIVAVEAMAAGTPVIAYKAGGALDYVVPGKTGAFFNEQSSDSLAEVLKSFDVSKFNHASISRQASNYSQDTFKAKFGKFIDKVTSRDRPPQS